MHLPSVLERPAAIFLPQHFGGDCSFGIHKKFRIAVGAVADCEIHSHISIAQLHLLLATVASQWTCLLYTSPSPRDRQKSRMPSSA